MLLKAAERRKSMTFGDFMKKARGNGISIYRLAIKTGITAKQLSNYEQGKSQPTIGKAEKICMALGVTYTIGG